MSTTKNVVFAGLIIGTTAYLMNKKKDVTTTGVSVADMRAKLIELAKSKNETAAISIFNKMTDIEIQYCYYFLFTYNAQLNTAPGNVKKAIPIIAKKYNIFN